MNLQRPFTKVVDVSGSGPTINVTLRDTEGSLLNCNYVKIQPLVDSTDDSYLVEFSGLASQQPSLNASLPDTSGVLGAVLPIETTNGSFETYFGSNAVTEVQITNRSAAGEDQFAVIYGVQVGEGRGWRSQIEVFGK